jgi:hypothetical protein
MTIEGHIEGHKILSEGLDKAVALDAAIVKGNNENSAKLRDAIQKEQQELAAALFGNGGK